jgi:hypothetical protein
MLPASTALSLPPSLLLPMPHCHQQRRCLHFVIVAISITVAAAAFS